MNNVVKRDGSKVDLNIDKIHQVLEWACDDIKNVSVSQIELNAKLQLINNIETKEIQKILIKSASDLISEKTPNYQYVASRLLLMELRKNVYGSFKPIPFIELIERNIKKDVYENILEYYTKDEINYFGRRLKYSNDDTFTYAMLRTMIDSYSVKNKKSLEIYETPQEMFMLISMMKFKNDKDIDRTLNYYELLTSYKISLPSPIMSGVRTKLKGYASCCLIDCGDTRDSLISANGASVLMTTMRAGIGRHNGWIRGIGAKVGKSTIHNGITRILKWSESSVKAFSQGERGGGSTEFFPFWHYEIERIIKLKSNKLPDDEAVRGVDYGIGFNKLFFDRVDNDENITLFSMEETKELLENVHDYDLWEETYLSLEKKRGIRKIKINAKSFFKEYLTEYFETGRVYPMFLDNMNDGCFKRPIYMSNLCLEILLPVKPLESLYDEHGEIALCILSNVNAGRIHQLSELENIAELLVRGLDNIIEIQDYPLPSAENSAKNGRYLAIGVSDWAHYLTKKRVRYDTQEALDITEEFMENLQYYLLKASNELAKERGECNWFRRDSKYSDGWLPNDGNQRFISMEKWNELRSNIERDGLRHNTLSGIPPAATSSDGFGASSGIDMPRGFLTNKNSKHGVVKQIVPNFSKGSSYYTLSGELDNLKYLEMISKFQLYVDNGISTNTYFDESDLDVNGNMSIKKLRDVILTAHELKLKTLYYQNYDDSAKSVEDEELSCSGGGCQV